MYAQRTPHRGAGAGSGGRGGPRIPFAVRPGRERHRGRAPAPGELPTGRAPRERGASRTLRRGRSGRVAPAIRSARPHQGRDPAPDQAHRDARRQRHGRDDTHAPDERPHDLHRHHLPRHDEQGVLLPGGEQHDERQRGAYIRQDERVDGRRDVRAADVHGPAGELPAAGVRVGGVQFMDGRRLGDGDVVEHAERPEDDRRQDEAAEVQLRPAQRGQEAGGLRAAQGRETGQRIEGDRPLYNIYITLKAIPDGLADGMTADTAITIASRDGVLCLPRAVVRASSGDTTLVKVWDGVQEISKEITIGLRGDTNVEIVSGLNEGEQVVTR